MPSHKTCSKCGVSKPLEKFSKRSDYKDGYRTQCRQCRTDYQKTYVKTPSGRASRQKYNEKRPPGHWMTPKAIEGRRKYQLRTKYGITEEDFAKRSAKQGGLCAICGSGETGWRYDVLVVDHCHDTGRVRGLLCAKCNLALGRLGDNKDNRLVEYLTKRET